MENRQIDKKKTKQIRIDVGYHKLLKIEAANKGRSIKQILESHIAEILGVLDEKGE